jgi:hypothetical protein
MTTSTEIAAVAELLMETGKAHHRAFAAVDGADPEWPRWYAQHLVHALEPHGVRLPVDRLAAELIHLEADHRADPGVGPWPEYYAARLLGKHPTP